MSTRDFVIYCLGLGAGGFATYLYLAPWKRVRR